MEQRGSEQAVAAKSQKNRGTKDNPIFVWATSTSEAQEKADRDAAYQQAGAADKHVIEVGIGAVVVAFMQFVALYITFRVMRNTGRNQLRAYISVTPVKITSFRVGEKPTVQYAIRNEGETPARHVGQMAFVDILPNPLPPSQPDLVKPYETQRIPSLTLHKGAQVVGDETKEAALTAEDISALTSSDDRRLFVAGIVNYSDVFGRRLWTRFAASLSNDMIRKMVEAQTQGSRVVPRPELKIDWEYDHEHNDDGQYPSRLVSWFRPWAPRHPY